MVARPSSPRFAGSAPTCHRGREVTPPMEHLVFAILLLTLAATLAIWERSRS